MKGLTLPPWLASVLAAWRWLLHLAVLALSVRFCVAAGQGDPIRTSATLLVLLSTAGLAVWQSGIALQAAIVSVPLAIGLGRTGVLPVPEPAVLVFCGVFAGYVIRAALDRLSRRETNVAGASPWTAADIWIEVATSLMLTIILVSLGQRLGSMDNGWAIATSMQSVFGFSDPKYFMTASFVWCMGLTLFRLCLSHGFSASGWLHLGLGTTSAAVVIFFLIQCSLGLPEALPVWAYEGQQHSLAFCGAYEDMHAFGSVAAALFAGLLILGCRGSGGQRAAYLASALGMGVLVVFSFSRAAWTAAAIAALIVTSMHLPRRAILGLVGGLVALVAFVNFTGDRPFWREQSYLYRLKTLVQIEPAGTKLSSRFFMYHKAAGLIEARPLAGHGIGSFYLKSPQFADPRDPLATLPDFAHNFFLQSAAELGLPFAMILVGCVAVIVFRGLRTWFCEPSLFAVSAVIITYLLTQLTANSLNIYVSQQWFFWPLLAALAVSCRKNDAARLSTR